MNERIKKIVDQAKVNVLTTKGHEMIVDGCYIVSPDKLQHFAELIVKECISMSDELKAQYLSHRKNTMDFDEKQIYAEGEAACDTMKYKMKKHFGVAE